MTIGEKIHELRVRRCMTLDEFAKIVGTHFETVSRWETGKSVPSFKSIKKIATSLGIDPSILSKCL